MQNYALIHREGLKDWNLSALMIKNMSQMLYTTPVTICRGLCNQGLNL